MVGGLEQEKAEGSSVKRPGARDDTAKSWRGQGRGTNEPAD